MAEHSIYKLMRRLKSNWCRLCGSRSRYMNGRRLGDQMVTVVVPSALRCKKWFNCKDQQSKFTNSFWWFEMFIPKQIFGRTGLLQMSLINGQSGLFRNTCAAYTGRFATLVECLYFTTLYTLTSSGIDYQSFWQSNNSNLDKNTGKNWHWYSACSHPRTVQVGSKDTWESREI